VAKIPPEARKEAPSAGSVIYKLHNKTDGTDGATRLEREQLTNLFHFFALPS
jgi:hypothetical protein